MGSGDRLQLGRRHFNRLPDQLIVFNRALQPNERNVIVLVADVAI